MTWVQPTVDPPKSSDFNASSNNRDPLSRRIMALVAPINSMHPIGGSVSQIISNTREMRENICQTPFPSFPYHESNLSQGKADVQDPNGYDEHAYFFHPRRIQADQPRHDLVGIQNNHNDNICNDTIARNTNENQLRSGNNWQEKSDSVSFFDSTQNINHSDSNHPFGFIYEDADMQPALSKKRSKKQRRLTSSDNAAVLERGWEQVGQVTTYYSSEQWNNTLPERETEKRKKKKKKAKKTKEHAERDIREAMEPHLVNRNESNDTSNHSTNDPEGSTGKTSRIFPESLSVLVSGTDANKVNKSKVNKSKATRSEGSSMRHSTQALKTISMETMELFSETYNVKNAGSSVEALNLFLSLVKDQRYVSWTIVFYDNICSSPFLPSNKKYCTPKGPPCRMWNCTCDSQVRAMQASAPILGAMFVFPCTEEDELDLFFLPLCPTTDPDSGPNDIDDGYERMANWPSLVINCETTLHQRWDTLRAILLCKDVTKVTFNAQMALMPFHYHSANDIVNNENSKIPSVGYLDLDLPSIWDLRLASWMLSPHAEESTLEIEHKKEGFAHLYPKEKIPRPSNICRQLNGLIDIKEQLEFLYSLYPIIDGLLERNGLKSAFSEIESPVQSILSSMECVGIGFKAERLVSVEESVKEQIQKLTAEARVITNDSTFTLSSPQQVAHYLFDTLGLTIPESVGFGTQNSSSDSQQHRSTSEESLKALQKQVKNKSAEDLRIIEIILQFRTLNKMLTTYILPYSKLARDSTNISKRKVQERSKKKVKSRHVKKIHPMWIQTAVRTGRLSCRKPNLQQVPAGNTLGFSPRSAFTSSTKDTCLFACDYSQNEVRILAHMSNDPALIRMFNDPKTTDIYIQMASVISGKCSDDVSDEERSTAKQLTLAIMYGMGPNTVANKLGVGLSTAKQFFESFYGRFKGVKKWKEETLQLARKNKYVETITGRKRYLYNIDSHDRSLSAQAERQAINTVIQGSAADLMKLAMLKMASRITDWRKEGTGNGETGIPPRILLQIHDELLFELVANQADVDKLKETVTRCCTEECVDELQLKVPLKLKCSIGTSWGSMQEIS